MPRDTTASPDDNAAHDRLSRMAATARAVAPRRASAHSRARRADPAIVRQHPLHRGREFAPRRPPPRTAPAARNSSAIAWKFSMCGPTITGLPNSAGSRILCPPRCRQRTAHEHAIRQAKQSASSPMESSSSTPGASAPSPSWPSRDRRTYRMPAASSLPATDVESLRLARHQHQEDVLAYRATPRSPHRLHPRRSSAIVLAAIHTFAGRTRSIQLHHGRSGSAARGAKSYFKFPPTATRCRRPARGSAARISSVCARIDIHRGQHRRKYPSQPQVPGQRPIRNPPVDDRQARAGPAHLAEQVRPDLGLRHHHQRRASACGARAARRRRNPPARRRFRRRCPRVSARRWRVPRASRWRRIAGSAGTLRAALARTPRTPEFRPWKLHATRSRRDQSV